MPRTVVHPQAAGAATRADTPAPDTVPDKLLKYIPGEVIAFYIPAYSLIDTNAVDKLRLGLLAVATVCSVGYLWVRAPKGTAAPRWYFYVLAALAFLVWAFGASPVGADLWGWSPQATSLSLMVGVFVIPLIDQVLTRLYTGVSP